MHLGYQRYTDSKVHTATKGELMLVVYDTALQSLRSARKALTGTLDLPVAHASIVKAQRALEELQLSLDMTYGEFSANLYGLYDFLIHELVLANTHKDVTRVETVLRMMDELADAWRTVVRTTATSTAVAS